MNLTAIEYIREHAPDLSDFRLRGLELDTSKRLITAEFVHPRDFQPDQAVISRLEKLLKEFFDIPAWRACAKLFRSYADEHALRVLFGEFAAKYPSLSTAGDLQITIADGLMEIGCDNRIHRYVKEAGIEKGLNELIRNNFCEEIIAKFRLLREIPREELQESIAEDELPQADDDVPPRFIEITQFEPFVGELAERKAGYIKDIVSERDYAVICGRVSGMRKFLTKEKNKPFYKFMLVDPTGKLTVKFSPKKDDEGKAERIADGDELIIRGSVRGETYNNKSSFALNARAIGYCKLPEKFVEAVIKKSPPAKYSIIKPRPFVPETEQATFFYKPQPIDIPPFCLNKTFVVFDLETTGTDVWFDKVTEICGIKIENGKMTEIFHTLTDPEMPIPTRITTLTGITDVDVAGKPKFETVIPDFMKFCEGAVLVAHNAPFDTGFLRRFGEPQSYFFENEVIDTLKVAQKHLHLERNRLEDLVTHFGFVNESAHRAEADTEVLCRVFLKLAAFL